MTYTIHGADFSHWQVIKDYQCLADYGFRFCFIKASEALWKDTRFDEHWAGLNSINMPRAGYHYYRPRVNATKQADFFYKSAGSEGLFPIGDFEGHYGTDRLYYKVTPKRYIHKNIMLFLERCEEMFGIAPIIYTSWGFWNWAVGNTTWAKNYLLWNANYGVTKPRPPFGWEKETFWQYTSKLYVAGVQGSVDGNWFNGSEYEFSDLIGGTSPPSTPLTLEERVENLETCCRGLGCNI
jgi:GH25 family lysozyme M1 (1,4-beta-N-acetylmuramidase)